MCTSFAFCYCPSTDRTNLKFDPFWRHRSSETPIFHKCSWRHHVLVFKNGCHHWLPHHKNTSLCGIVVSILNLNMRWRHALSHVNPKVVHVLVTERHKFLKIYTRSIFVMRNSIVISITKFQHVMTSWTFLMKMAN